METAPQPEVRGAVPAVSALCVAAALAAAVVVFIPVGRGGTVLALAVGIVATVVSLGPWAWRMRRDLDVARREAESLRASERLLLGTIDALRSRIAVLDDTGAVLALNASGRDLLDRLGVTGGGDDVTTLYIPPSDESGSAPRRACAAWEGIQAVLSGARREFQLEYPCRVDGERRWHLIRVMRIDQEGAPGGSGRVVVANEDITERVRAAQALQESEARFRAMVSSMDDLVFALDHDLRCIGVHGRWLEQTGFEPRALLGRSFRDVLGDAAAPHETAGRRALGGEHVIYGWTLTHGGEERHIETSVSPMRAENGAVIGAVGVGRDVTARVREEREVRRRDAILQAVAFAFGRFLHSADWEDAIDEVLAELGQATGVDCIYLAEHDEVGDPVDRRRYVWRPALTDGREMPHAIELPGGLPAHWADRLARGEVVGGWTCDLPAAEREAMEARGIRSTVLVPVLAGEQWLGFLGFDDAVEREWATIEVEALRTAADTLGAAMARKRIERALREREEQLREAQKMEAVGRLAGGIAHDFNNLLTAITGHSELLLAEMEEGVRARDDLAEIRDAAERAATLTRQLLAFSRRQVLELRVLDLNQVVRDVEKMLRRLIGEDVLLLTRLAPRLGAVRADPNHIAQVLMNLAVNARDAMPGGGLLTIETAECRLDRHDGPRGIEIEPGDYVVLKVVDTGSGIPEEIRERIFEPFFTTKAPGKGTGLGLSMVYGIVKQSGGYITVESEVGQGASFRILLPRVAADAEPMVLENREAEPPATGNETVLLVEDESAVRSLVRRVLERRGYKVLEATNGAEAIQLAAGYPDRIDLVLTDVVMPDLAGPELVESLAPLRPEMRVIFMSGYADHEVVRRGVLEYRAGFIGKPFSPDSLSRKVREILDATAAPA
ncbi:MAG TPA: PAS domain-containing protein [Longimicrobiales bacterium]